jgi:type IV pilus assembly protein PilC
MFANRIPLKRLALLCRSLSTTLHSGVPVVKAFELSAKKSHDPRLRSVMADVGVQLRSGEDVASAMRSHQGYFPDLTVDMIDVAERTGNLPEVLRALADHYENNLRLRRDFITQIAFPVIQFTAAIFVVAGLIFLLGIIGSASGEPLDVLGFGLSGASGALLWLSGWAIVLAGAFVFYKVAVSSLQGQKILHQSLLNIPVIGGCMRSFAIARFSWAYHLTQEAGMPVDESLEASLRATANGAFIARAPQIIADVMEGETLTDALAHTQLFPEEFIETVHTAETSGTVPETLHRLSPQFEDQARRSLRALAITAGWLVWLCVAIFIIFLILRIVLWYTGMLNDFANEALGV